MKKQNKPIKQTNKNHTVVESGVVINTLNPNAQEDLWKSGDQPDLHNED